VAHQVGVGELDAGALGPVVVEAVGGERGVQPVAQGVASAVALLEVQHGGSEGRDGIRPADAGLVVVGFDQRADQAGHADAVAAHLGRHQGAVRAGHLEVHRGAVFRAEVEDVADLDASGGDATLFRDRAPGGFVVLFVGGGVPAGPELHGGGEVALVIRRFAEHVEVEQVAVQEDLALAGVGQDDEFVAEIATDRSGRRPHGDGLQPHAREGAEVGHEHAPVARLGALAVEVEGVGVLHQELAAAHDAEARAHLVPELPLDVVEVARQVAVGAGVAAKDLGDHLLVGRTVQHVPVVAVLEAQHFRPVGVVAAALAPEVGGLHRRHQDFLRAGGVLLFADDLLHPSQHAPAERQPSVDAGRGLADHAGAQHQAVRGDLRVRRRLLEGGQEGSGQAQRGLLEAALGGAPDSRWRRAASPGFPRW
jgi:hypothetical protein